MPLLVPQPIKAFNRNLSIIPAKTYREPVEGKMIVPLEIDWDGAGSTFDINCAARAGQTFTQIVMLDVDNSASGADVQFIFPDTSDTLTVPAYSAGTFPVFTGGVSFYAAAPAALASDITRVRVLNFRQEPIANPAPQFHNVVASGVIAIAAGTTAILPAATSGTLIGYSVFANIAGAGSSATFEVVDHASGKIIDLFNAATGFQGLGANVMGCAFRFAGGIDFTMTVAGAPTGAASVNLKYRSP